MCSTKNWTKKEGTVLLHFFCLRLYFSFRDSHIFIVNIRTCVKSQHLLETVHIAWPRIFLHYSGILETQTSDDDHFSCFFYFQFSVDDEYVIQTAITSNKASQSLVIFDARSVIAASGNQLKVNGFFHAFDVSQANFLRMHQCTIYVFSCLFHQGKGTEDIERYPGCKLTFLNIPNIHAVRDSLERLQTACKTSEKKWFSQLEASGWMAYISLILQVIFYILYIVYFCLSKTSD